MAKIHKTLHFLLMIGFLTCTTFSCTIISPEPELPYSENSGNYSFDKNTLFNLLEQGSLDVFTPVPDVSLSPTPWTPSRNQLSFADYLVVAQVFHQWKWSEPMSKWSLNKLEYHVPCGNTLDKPSFAEIVLFNINHQGEKDTRLVHKILIGYPDNTLYWSEAERYPVNENWQVIDLTKILMPAEEALKIAEVNGGSAIRLSVNNDCRINIFTPNLSESDWLIEYNFYSADKGWFQILKAYVDKSSGKYRIDRP
jgi:hypothetical protein